jgi:hypothetical protein
MMGVTLSSAVLAGLAAFAYETQWFNYLLIAELFVGAIVYAIMRESVSKAQWSSIE